MKTGSDVNEYKFKHSIHNINTVVCTDCLALVIIHLGVKLVTYNLQRRKPKAGWQCCD